MYIFILLCIYLYYYLN